VEIKQIKELMTAMGRTGTKRLCLKKEDFELTLEREDHAGRYMESPLEYSEENHRAHSITMSQHRADQTLSRGAELPAAKMTSSIASEPPKVDSHNIYVTSPMVGTFYVSPSPEDPAFVKVGDKIEKNTVVCIIEAMKVMNEIKANVSGVVVEVLVEPGQPVEFGTKLFRITE
jgi:acetyl-CoA carboxylase biotin carboxyl carrier protein